MLGGNMGLEVLALKFKHLMYTSDALQCHRPTWQDLVGKLCVLKYLLSSILNSKFNSKLKAAVADAYY